jgi:alginate O-acetyltransferase complex protein AlgJ
VSRKSPLDFLLVISFLSVLTGPMIVDSLGFQVGPDTSENRTLSSLPVIESFADLEAFPKSFDSYYQDVFGLREVLVEYYGRYKLFLGSSPSEKVIIGQNGWLFYTGNKVIDNVRGIRPLSNAYLEKERQHIEAKSKWLESLGIKYIYLIAPDKHSVYSEHLPNLLPVSEDPSRLDQLVDYLRKNSSVSILDLRPAFDIAKEEQRLYHKTDSHWNQLGAFVAYKEILKILEQNFPTLNVKNASDFNLQQVVGSGGDLAKLFGISNAYQEERYVLKPQAEACNGTSKSLISEDLALANKVKINAYHCDGAELPGLLFFGDSFGNALLPFLKGHFSHTEKVVGPLRAFIVQDLIQKYSPSVVIEESVERMFSKRPRTSEIEEISLQRDFGKLEPNFVIDPSNLKRSIGAVHKLSLSSGETTFNFKVLSLGGFAVLKDINFGDSFEHIFHIKIESPKVSNMKVFFRTSSEPKFGMIPPKTVKLKVGLNDVYFKIYGESLLSTVRIDPGSEVGDYIVRDLEIRSGKIVP